MVRSASGAVANEPASPRAWQHGPPLNATREPGDGVRTNAGRLVEYLTVPGHTFWLVISGCGRILERSSVRHDVERRNEVYARGTRTMPGRPLSVVAGLLIVAATMPVSIEEAHAQAPRREIVGRNAPALAHGPPAPAAGERRPLLEAIRERRRAAKRAPTTKPRVGDSLRLDPVAAAGISPAAAGPGGRRGYTPGGGSGGRRRRRDRLRRVLLGKGGLRRARLGVPRRQ